MPLEPVPIRSRRRQPMPVPSSSALVGENLYSSLLLGSGLMASLSAAACLQHLLPECRIDGFPVAGLIGLLSGWLLTLPLVRWTTRRLDPARFVPVLVVAVLSGLVWATPAACFAPAIGWMGGALRLYIVAGVLSASGLIWGGYLDCDRWIEW